MESIGTVKAFFIFFGSLAVLGCIAEARDGQVPLVGLCFAILTLCIGLFLRGLLPRHAWLISSLLIVGFLYTLVIDIASIASGESPVLKKVVDLFIRLFLTFYLLSNVKRLATEAQMKDKHNPKAQADG